MCVAHADAEAPCQIRVETLPSPRRNLSGGRFVFNALREDQLAKRLALLSAGPWTFELARHALLQGGIFQVDDISELNLNEERRKVESLKQLQQAMRMFRKSSSAYKDIQRLKEIRRREKAARAKGGKGAAAKGKGKGKGAAAKAKAKAGGQGAGRAKGRGKAKGRGRGAKGKGADIVEVAEVEDIVEGGGGGGGPGGGGSGAGSGDDASVASEEPEVESDQESVASSMLPDDLGQVWQDLEMEDEEELRRQMLSEAARGLPLAPDDVVMDDKGLLRRSTEGSTGRIYGQIYNSATSCQVSCRAYGHTKCGRWFQHTDRGLPSTAFMKRWIMAGDSFGAAGTKAHMLLLPERSGLVASRSPPRASGSGSASSSSGLPR